MENLAQDLKPVLDSESSHSTPQKFAVVPVRTQRHDPDSLSENFNTAIEAWARHALVVHAVNKVTLSRSTIVFGKARSAGKAQSTRCARGAGPGMPFPRSATQSKNDCAAALRERLCGRDSALCFLTRACHCLRNTP